MAKNKDTKPAAPKNEEAKPETTSTEASTTPATSPASKKESSEQAPGHMYRKQGLENATKPSEELRKKNEEAAREKENNAPVAEAEADEKNDEPVAEVPVPEKRKTPVGIVADAIADVIANSASKVPAISRVDIQKLAYSNKAVGSVEWMENSENAGEAAVKINGHLEDGKELESYRIPAEGFIKI